MFSSFHRLKPLISLILIFTFTRFVTAAVLLLGVDGVILVVQLRRFWNVKFDAAEG